MTESKFEVSYDTLTQTIVDYFYPLEKRDKFKFINFDMLENEVYNIIYYALNNAQNYRDAVNYIGQNVLETIMPYSTTTNPQTLQTLIRTGLGSPKLNIEIASEHLTQPILPTSPRKLINTPPTLLRNSPGSNKVSGNSKSLEHYTGCGCGT